MKKTVLLGVTGCVAAYKACEVVRGLQKAGLRVKVVMTKNATEFINPGQFRALTREPVAVGTFDDAPGDPIHHISLSKEADVFLIAPCTANVLGKIANGIADDLLTTTAMATTAPIVLAPAMNVNMYENEATQHNLMILAERGVRIVDADSGYLACGDVGKGRLAEPADIVKTVLDVLEVKRDMKGKRVVVTAGPTVEPIDAVRYISNPSSGKMGFALAEAAADRGADVVLVTGPVGLDDPEDVEVVRVKTAQEMFNAVDGVFADSDIAVFSAALRQAPGYVAVLGGDVEISRLRFPIGLRQDQLVPGGGNFEVGVINPVFPGAHVLPRAVNQDVVPRLDGGFRGKSPLGGILFAVRKIIAA